MAGRLVTTAQAAALAGMSPAAFCKAAQIESILAPLTAEERAEALALYRTTVMNLGQCVARVRSRGPEMDLQIAIEDALRRAGS